MWAANWLVTTMWSAPEIKPASFVGGSPFTGGGRQPVKAPMTRNARATVPSIVFISVFDGNSAGMLRGGVGVRRFSRVRGTGRRNRAKRRHQRLAILDRFLHHAQTTAITGGLSAQSPGCGHRERCNPFGIEPRVLAPHSEESQFLFQRKSEEPIRQGRWRGSSGRQITYFLG